jgi:glycosyltransferase involved in cell wall biosynthesis
MPRVSIVMPAYNAEPFLSEAIDSLLGQTFSDFELIIVDDASTDGTAQMLAGYAMRDQRIVPWRNDVNLGQARTMNRALDAARGEYIARLDHDDVALPRRLELQVAFLDRHRDIGLLGSGSWLIDAEGHPRGGSSLMPVDDLQIRWSTMYRNPIHHSTVMLRRDVLERNRLRYDSAWLAQDYDLWVRMLRHTRAANFSTRLTKYRVRAASVTRMNLEVLRRETAEIALRAIQQELPGFPVSLERVAPLVALCSRWPMPGLSAQRAALEVLLLDLLAAFLRAHAGEPRLDALRRYAAFRIARVVFRGKPRPQWPRMLGRLLRLNPALPWFALRYRKSFRRRASR